MKIDFSNDVDLETPKYEKNSITKSFLSPDVTVGAGQTVPEILAPAGGPSQFLAALNAGADAVFLGLKQFNARSRAENFSIEDLELYVPLAHKYGMKVLVTLNILIKEEELLEIIPVLADLSRLEVDGVIVQDLGLVRLLRKHFSNLPIHASTQMAVHNLHGVKMAKKLGIKRVVLARELTGREIKLIRQGTGDHPIELEAFCHGSLCYSYSGLCFFSGQDDARSGNRGECAYTCRKPYKIKNEPGQGFLFSMKDLETLDDLKTIAQAGVHTLKIEGRKKDAQFVATVVKSYREKLTEILGVNTLRSKAPPVSLQDWPNVRKDMAYSFHRDTTSLFLSGRYHENVIDLDNPTHKGALVGKVLKIDGQWITLNTQLDLEKYDGLRIDPQEQLYHARPQHGDHDQGSQSTSKSIQLNKKYLNDVLQFSLRELSVSNKRVPKVESNQLVQIEIPSRSSVKVGDLVYKTRSAGLKARVEKLCHSPDRLRKLVPVSAKIETYVNKTIGDDKVSLCVDIFKSHEKISSQTIIFEGIRPENSQSHSLEEKIKLQLSILGDIGVEIVDFSFCGDFQWFVPTKTIKHMKNILVSSLPEDLKIWQSNLEKRAVDSLHSAVPLPATSLRQQKLNIKFDRLEYLDHLSLSFEEVSNSAEIGLNEIIFEPKRAFLGQQKPEEVWELLSGFAKKWKVALRFALPTVIRAWDEPLLKRWIKVALQVGVDKFEIGNLGAKDLLEEVQRTSFLEKSREAIAAGETEELLMANLNLTSDFTLYAMNHVALLEFKDLGIQRYALSVENDRESIRNQLMSSQEISIAAELIVYKDTPLFLAESCSLTALHGGCPSASVCGYRTLEIENDEGEEFLVIHENCKSVVIGKNAFSISQERTWSAEQGIEFLRVDFLSRPYGAKDIQRVIKGVSKGETISETHSGNHFRKLL